MSTTLDFNMLCLEVPRNMLHITEGTHPMEEGVEIAHPVTWIRAMVHQQEQAEQDLRQLTDRYGSTIDRINRRIHDIETAFYTLAEGTRYVYDRVQASENITKEWVRSELVVAANAYQTFA